MSKIIVALMAHTALLLAGAGCTPSPTATPTDCVAGRPDAGSPDAVCGVAWSCNSDTQHYNIVCNLEGNNWSCACSSDTTTGTTTIVINTFQCNLTGGALGAAEKCGWILQM